MRTLLVFSFDYIVFSTSCLGKLRGVPIFQQPFHWLFKSHVLPKGTSGVYAIKRSGELHKVKSITVQQDTPPKYEVVWILEFVLSGSASRSMNSAMVLENSTHFHGDNHETLETEMESDEMDPTSISKVHQVMHDYVENDQIYMSVLWHGGRLGMAYYDLEMTQIFMLLDIVESDEFLFLKRVLQQYHPSCVVLSSKQDDRLVQTLRNLVSTRSDTTASMATDEISASFSDEDSDILQFLPSIDFSPDICKRRILNLDLPGIPTHYTDTEKTLYLSSLISFDNVATIRATGGLLKFLEKRRIGIELEDASVKVPVMDLKVITLDDQVAVDDTAFSALQIFQKEAHPSVYKIGQSGTKEGLSLFGLLNRCRSAVGSRKLRLWFLRPIRDLDVLKQRQDAVAFFVNPRNIEVFTTLTDCMKNVKNISPVLKRMHQAQAAVIDWQALYKTVYHAIYIGDLCRSQSQTIHIFERINEAFTDDLHRIANLINKIVDFDESKVVGRFVVKPNVDAELDDKKRTYNGLPDFMTKLAAEELERLSDDIQECNVIYLPQLGYLLAIPRLDYMQIETDFEIPGLEFVFLSNNMLHYKSARTRELDALLGDTQCEITDQETAIMHRLQNAILESFRTLTEVQDLCAELDCILSLAASAKEFNYVKPAVVNEDVINIKGGRHPIQEVCCSPFVPNDTLSDQAGGKMKVLTGPNASGKSVYLKQVALIVYMAHIGSFVPAESAVIGCVDRIFTRIRTLDSVSVGLSTFMIDVNQMSEAIRDGTERSLIVVDEFGKGTELVDGMALLCACLSFWIEKRESCPHVLVSTHFHSIIHQQLLPESPMVKFMTMDSLTEEGELLFLYQLVEGHAKSSYASHVALQAGLPEKIIQRGVEVSELIRQNRPVYAIDKVDSETHFKRSEIIVKKFLDLDLETDDLEGFLQDFVLPTSEGKL
ncbi:mutS protein homolog 5-like [Ostrea edulis]|uniref:mutS protein homolog 5-like n=1 Tax=Ostrea edulis TaxID=37623 RepID=UPI0024AFF545|nr:mutS protein homolog 5-like [Ostrea edulis]